MKQAHLLWVLLLWSALFVCVAGGPARADEAAFEFQFMRVEKRCGVYRAPNVNTAMFARVSEGAIVKVRLRRKMADCPAGWYERAEGGFICGKHLEEAEATDEQPGPEDAPGIRNGLTAVMLTVKKSEVFKKRGNWLRGRSDAVLLKGSVLTVEKTVEHRGKSYFLTRQGWYVPVEDCEPLPLEKGSLAFDVSSETVPGAVVVGRSADIYQSPSLDAKKIGTLKRWSRVNGLPEDAVISDGFVPLPSGGFVEDAALARFRRAVRPKDAAADERWVAVDLDEQLVTAYEGDSPVRIMPCSTGVRGNTEKGRYTVSRKLKQQTMRLRMCRVRVEDVQWVMYYDEEDAIAIHSAYWHDDFGTPVSHGCVNLPPADAKWLFDWTAPFAASTDSVTVPLPRGSGTKIVVF